MLNTFTLTVPVKSGRCQFAETELDRVREFLARFEGKVVEIRWAKPKSTRSLKQNAYYFGVVLTMISVETGNSVADLHEAYKTLFVTPKFVKIGSKEVQCPRTTTDLSPSEFNIYIEQVVAHAGQELGIVIPLPNGGSR